MSRLDPLDPPGEIADRVRERRGGSLRPLDKILLHSPPMAEGWNAMLGAVRRHSTLDDDVRESVILRVAVLNRAAYEWDAHAPIALRSGVSEAQLEHLREPAGPSPLTAEQQIAVEYAESLTVECDVSDDLFARARSVFGERGVVDLTVTVGAYNMVSRFLVAMRIGESGDSGPGRVVEEAR